MKHEGWTAWWLSCNAYTICIVVDEDNLIVAAPPVANGFIGQPARKLQELMKARGGFRYARLLQ